MDKEKQILRILIITLLICLPSYSQLENNFQPIKKEFNIEGKKKASVSFQLDYLEPFQFELDYVAQWNKEAKGKFVLLLNKIKVIGVEIVEMNANKRLKFMVPKGFFKKGENEISFEVFPPGQNVFFKGIKIYNYYGISPNSPVGYVLYDKRTRKVADSNSFVGKLARLFFPFMLVFFSLIAYLVFLRVILFDNFLNCYLSCRKFLFLPILLPWITLTSSLLAPYYIRFPEKTLVWLTILPLAIFHFLGGLISGLLKPRIMEIYLPNNKRGRIFAKLFHSINKNITKIITLVLLILLFGLPGYHESGDTVPNELLPLTIINEQNLDFNEFLVNSKYDFSKMISRSSGIPYFFSRVNERVISNYPIIPGILNLPIFFVAYVSGMDLHKNRISLSHITSVTVSLVSVVFIYFCLTSLCTKKNTAIFFTLVYALGTSVWSVASKAIWQHGPSVMFLSIALFFILNKNGKFISYSGFFPRNGRF